TDQQSLISHARMVRYGADEIVQYAGEVPTAMTFLIKGSIRRTTMNDDGSVVQLSLAGAYALEEVTALEIDREHIEDLVLRTPLLLQELGRIIEDRRSESSSVGAVSTRR